MEALPDPIKDRVIKEVLAPPNKCLSHELLYLKDKETPNIKNIREHLLREGKIDKKDFIDFINRVTNIVKKEPSVLRVSDPLTVVGDIHGQFYDFVNILEYKTGEDKENSQFLFLGDYVDRGAFSIECLILLFAMKIAHKKNVWLLRGNHECRQLTTYFNFRNECEVKYDLEIYAMLMNLFDCLPIACIINDKFFCVHGGISPNLEVITSLDKINRFSEIPKVGILCDLMWADPVDQDKESVNITFKENSVRGCSYYFGYKATKPFLQRNKLMSIFRAHESHLEGFKMYNWDKQDQFPQVITIFSAPNYCDVYNNKGSVVLLEANNFNVQQYNYNMHPYILPGFQNVFKWSIPFISEKISEMLYHIIKNEEYPKEDDQESSEIIDDAITESLRLKVKFVTLLMKMFKTIREEHELIMKLKGCCPGNKIPRGLITQGPNALKSAYDRYNKAKIFDIVNEKYPEDVESNKNIEYPG